MKHYESKEARCPFYRCEDKSNIHKVYCEGLDKGMFTHIVFANAGLAERYKTRYCYSKYNDCRYCKMLLDKYEKGEA